MRLALALGITACALLGACGAEPCEEDIRAQTGLPGIRLILPTETLEAEWASSSTELERGWKHRRCEREGLWLAPGDPATSLDLWGCGLVDPVSVYFVGDGVVLEVIESLDPCDEPCGACEFLTAPAGTTQALETLVGRVDLKVGDAVLLDEA